ncbi:hypothetical protein BAOM_4310 [Peribacillus asahii]|uniref:Uncharacterized protein n=1 Tax=Peribacillus asahii TaxID=228899 RepID=A0A3Q9RQI6_9BACI|nr:hypothetical protein BAOM_4310 [Peribacillus asahii]
MFAAMIDCFAPFYFSSSDPLAIHEAQNQRFTTENENGSESSRLGEEGR